MKTLLIHSKLHAAHEVSCCGNDGNIFKTPYFHKLTMNSLSVPLIHGRNDLVRLILQIESTISKLYVVNTLHDGKLHKECVNNLMDHEIFIFLGRKSLDAENVLQGQCKC